MKEVIRRGLFETNSSSTHSITICTNDEYTKWQKEELYFNRWSGELVPASEEIKHRRKEQEGTYRTFLTYDEFYDGDYMDYEIFNKSYTSPSGDIIHVFGYYGENR